MTPNETYKESIAFLMRWRFKAQIKFYINDQHLKQTEYNLCLGESYLRPNIFNGICCTLYK